MKYDEYDIDGLFALASKGDSAAFERIVTLTERLVYNLALSLVGRREDAEDITQETYLRLWSAIGRFRGESSAQLYILRITRNLAFDLLRLRARKGEPDSLAYFDAEGEEKQLDIPADGSYRPDEDYMKRFTASVVRECMEKLPIRSREIITLRDIDGLTYADISKLLGINENTAKTRVRRAREQLRALILRKNIF